MAKVNRKKIDTSRSAHNKVLLDLARSRQANAKKLKEAKSQLRDFQLSLKSNDSAKATEEKFRQIEALKKTKAFCLEEAKRLKKGKASYFSNYEQTKKKEREQRAKSFGRKFRRATGFARRLAKRPIRTILGLTASLSFKAVRSVYRAGYEVALRTVDKVVESRTVRAKLPAAKPSTKTKEEAKKKPLPKERKEVKKEAVGEEKIPSKKQIERSEEPVFNVEGEEPIHTIFPNKDWDSATKDWASKNEDSRVNKEGRQIYVLINVSDFSQEFAQSERGSAANQTAGNVQSIDKLLGLKNAYEAGGKVSVLAKQFSMSESNVYDLAKRHGWKRKKKTA